MSSSPATATRVSLLVLSPERIIYQGAVLWAQIPLSDGFIGVWPEHTPLVASLGQGTLHYDAGSGPQAISVEGGILRIDEERCVVLLGIPSIALEFREEPDRDALFVEMEDQLNETLSDEQLRDLQGA